MKASDAVADALRVAVEGRLAQLHHAVAPLDAEGLRAGFGMDPTRTDLAYGVELAGCPCAYCVSSISDDVGHARPDEIDRRERELRGTELPTARTVVGADLAVDGAVRRLSFYAAILARPETSPVQVSPPGTVVQAMDRFLEEFWTGPEMGTLLRRR